MVGPAAKTAAAGGAHHGLPHKMHGFGVYNDTAVAILALEDPALRGRLLAYRAEQTARVLREDLNGESSAWSERPSER